MGIERTETVTVTYMCDRCEVAHVAGGSHPIEAPEGWLDVKLQTLSGFSTPMRRVLCVPCKTALQSWFLDNGGAF
jgi:hypothetical protein